MTTPIPARENLFRKLTMLAKILGFFGLTSCALPPAPGEPEKLGAVREKEEVAVFFIGNSYSFGVPKQFSKIAGSRGRKVRVGHSTYGGWTLAKHAAHPPTLEKLRSGKWDVVVIQEQSLVPSRHERMRRKVMDPAVGFLVSEARAAGAVPLLYQTWGRRDGDPDRPGDDFIEMNSRVRNGYRAASENAGGVAIVPAGDAWEREFVAGRGRDLFIDDGSHPSSFGNEITAREFYRVIFGGVGDAF
jgi:hypothetical protein